MSLPQTVIAVIFDFDDTLTDDSTSGLLESRGIDVETFWAENNERVKGGWDPTLSYLNLILDKTGTEKPLGNLSNRDLKAFGATLKFYPGIPQIFHDLTALASNVPSRPIVEFYVISGGIEEVIAGSSIAKHLHGFRGCRYSDDGGSGPIRQVMNAVSFTDKTRYIFEINKGILGRTPDSKSRSNPYEVNESYAESSRRIPLENMIYVGDGFTDVPCFSLLKKNHGRGFGIFDPKKAGSPKKGWEKLLAPERVTSMHSPKYGEDDDLGSILRMAVQTLCASSVVQSRTA